MIKRETSMLTNLLARLRGAPKPPPVQQEAPRPFQAISIYRGISCCALAKKLSEHRFLAKDAPALPLGGCTMPQRCQCRYIKHKDRRAGERRHLDFGLGASMYSGKERRRFSDGRRK
jgi:hypothetical protein